MARCFLLQSIDAPSSGLLAVLRLLLLHNLCLVSRAAASDGGGPVAVLWWPGAVLIAGGCSHVIRVYVLYRYSALARRPERRILTAAGSASHVLKDPATGNPPGGSHAQVTPQPPLHHPPPRSAASQPLFLAALHSPFEFRINRLKYLMHTSLMTC